MNNPALNPNGTPASEPYSTSIEDLHLRLRIVREALALTLEDVLEEVHQLESRHSDALHMITFSVLDSFVDVLDEMAWGVEIAKANGCDKLGNEAWHRRYGSRAQSLAAGEAPSPEPSDRFADAARRLGMSVVPSAPPSAAPAPPVDVAPKARKASKVIDDAIGIMQRLPAGT